MPSKLFNCFLCGYSIDKLNYVCNPCYELLPWNSHACYSCSVALPYASSLSCSQKPICAKCRLTTPKYQILAPFKYDEVIVHIIKSIKYHGAAQPYAFLAETLVNYLLVNAYLSKIDVVIPVPLFPAKQSRRGFNQAIELAKAINKTMGINIDYFGCERIKNTPSQTKYNIDERRSNLRNSFVARRNFSGERVVILDDVVTTGATVNALAEVIYGKGALMVEVWAIARANKSL